ncbi:cysteine hydrolase [Pseudooceanicola sp. CBS1P-1]|uniref:Isochorismatase family protein n=1 Tax=Pseudooceanicola albus TaxID=2692189 RepID=A0A6L7G798_9RHOB|nr:MULTISPECIES: cysteine hydrolase [Pseudooceanicola]MBT9386115.1 cysteine hydrolase [Pseudooceanicola endophyticus]MXN19467.1 isochorismatase family protein [Pseudooceanicola albus]
MHKIKMSDAALERGRKNRDGRDHAYEAIDPTRTAHVVVDLQNGFMEVGAVSEVPVARDIVPNVNALSRALRAAGGHNVFLRYTFDAAEARPWTSWYGDMLGKPFSEGLAKGFTRGDHAHDLWPGLDVAQGDPVLDKTRFSGFIAGTCDLDAVLQSLGVDTVLITGTVTNCCSETTARDAHQLSYRVIFVADGNAALNDAEHNGTLDSLYPISADIRTTEEVLALIEAGTARRSAAE